MRWKNFAKILAQFTFEICGGVFFVCFGIVLFLKVLHMISALAKEKKKVSELVDTFYTIKRNVTESIESTWFL